MRLILRSCIFFTLSLGILHAIDYETSFTFAWLTDTHIGSGNAANYLRDIVRDIDEQDDIRFVIVSGDITETDTGDNLLIAKRILDSLDIPYHIIPGNHDTKWSSSGASLFTKLWGDDRFNFEAGNYRFIGIHQGPLLRMGDGYIDPDDLNWIRSILETLADPAQRIFIIMHYPLDPSVDNWYVLRDILQDYNIQAVLHGHGHANRAVFYEGIPGLMSRSTLARNEQASGYTLIAVNHNKAEIFERIPETDSLNLWHTLNLGERDFTDSLRLSPPDYSANDSSGVSLIWQVETGSILTSSPVAVMDRVIISSTDGSVCALDLETGIQLWNWQGKGAIHSTPAIKGGSIVFGATDSSISCLSIQNGKLKWQTALNSPILSSAVIHRNRVYMGSGNGSFHALNLRNGRIKWTNSDFQGFIETKPIIADNKIMFGAWNGSFYALKLSDGSLAWEWSDGRPGDLYSPAACWPVVAHGKVFIVAPDRAMTAIDIRTGLSVWRRTDMKVREMIGASEEGETIFVRAMTDSVYAIKSEPSVFNLNWKVNAGYGYDFAPSMMMEKAGRVFFGTKGGWIYSLNASDGEVVWKYRISDGLMNTVYPLDANSVLTTGADGKVSLLRFSSH
ncbi:MAG: PQQ-binding-like beta-propeller repeat protein [Candidatus Marinimicrobia bacterium]|nr:PQQ-binding-like beta-propeller repeat protein [Candidatus Neomarinimicrobiota bacterium]